MLLSHPAVQNPSIYRAYLYRVMYLVLLSLPMVWENTYDQSVDVASLNYLSLCVDFMNWSTDQPSSHGQEWRVPPMLIGAILCPIGLFIYGWTAGSHINPIIPNIGCAILAIGLIISFQCSQAYMNDAYEAKYAASAAAVGAFLRTMCGFTFPLFATQMYEKLDVDWGNSLLGFLTLVLAIVGPVVL
ncbi:hypothetical protein BDV96DRAFT_596578 [Lophiotrema nucula]|uniref:Major facilitator superfamily domain-containing protein n=1 Tax=Lophiotrema nucula TaxID=690887 RepID=A0A6A5ZI59_9PLEO|nr:hypothetical protein BDV96DRAFT_596578 [Lophiotrema nucula]